MVLLAAVLALCSACNMGNGGEIERIIRRYNELLIQGYRTQNMNPLLEVTTHEHALKLYHHMAALGEGQLQMESRLKGIRFLNVERRGSAEAMVETEETWDFTHYRMATREKYAEEKDFIYRMGYVLNRVGGRWVITRVTTVGGTSTNNVIPWPVLDRAGRTVAPSGKAGAPAEHP
jgi:hypothetical protein